ncbi:DUF5067 domain-containing protein [Lentilactobacillus otakiensis]|jgi:hypothetical protein|uniref:DUF5067 domain-containing protein n=1 Tax=Lentilactobacillus otakiensis DSM 19908 = JCM 15040 TaxID=1423780 RepID=S4PNS1_9LACO|nr:DUF5067 domain-containing protein [Lentilactobacillus otakiensis]KRL08954.1 hypothetical protein FD05_GL001041 [Lentilactobacillus otakiensis DSM 19908 = JCM 15040]MBZ3775567.1 DUF5067 domain-containing protein [Lentilactobacillus otakiensis]MDV3518787.1 DUF5067 domain-containing protein [Lentilactobacillus otakiensis]GAD16055.1 conserved hypothetical protein [Lentilactobacillus otakiensis DSM 19908 = JCM 15040]
MKKTLLFLLTLTALISLSGCGMLGQSKNSANSQNFSKNSLKVKNFHLKITKTAVIPAGTSGNEFGKKPIFAIWYTITNTSGKKVSPVSAASVLRAYQPAKSKKQLVAAPLPDQSLAAKYKINIKKNQSAKGSMAWNLYDTKSSIKIHGVKYGTNQTIGVQTYSIK